MASVLDRLANWLESEPGSDLRQFRSQFRQLHDDQQDADYAWHVENVWSRSLRDLLGRPDRLTQSSVTDWRQTVADGTSFTDLPVIQLINVTMEMGPGFDVIDPRGPLTDDSGRNDFGLWFVPVEIKAVNGTQRPFTFRLTTNEYRRAKAFVRAGIPYVVRLIAVPEPDTLDWPTETTVAAEKVLSTVEDVERVVDASRFEEVVKGGYMNMRIE
jgi:hypothetical protein